MEPITPETNNPNTINPGIQNTPDSTQVDSNVSNMSHSSIAPNPSSVSLPKTGSLYFNNSIFWIEVEKIVPNPYQPRREFDQHALRDLSESIRMYGLLQPLVVTRREIIKEDGGLVVQYELISGERRLRASKLAGLSQVPVIIRAGEEDARVKLELAIIENLQREDLNAVDRARSFQRLADEFGLKHVQIAEKMGKSREYVTNSIRLLSLPEHMLMALSEKKISEGHTRPLLMLVGRPEEQETLFKEIVFKKITVREAESIARRVAVERTRKKDLNTPDPEIREFETKLNQALGTRVLIEKKDQGGKVVIDFFSNQDLRHLIDMLENNNSGGFNSANISNSAEINVIKPLFGGLPEYVPQNSVSSTATGAITDNAEVTKTTTETTVETTTETTTANSTPAVDFSGMNSIASSIDYMAGVSEKRFGADDMINLVQTEIEPKVFGVNSFQDGGIVSHIEPSVDTTDFNGNINTNSNEQVQSVIDSSATPVDDSIPSDAKDDEDLYSIKNFSI
jgi:ParB family chromosome partitioning protein